MFDEVHERFDSGQTGVASSWTVGSCFLKVFQKLEHERRIQLFQLQGRGSNTKLAASEAEKKLEKAIRAGTVRRYHGIDWIGDAATKGVITESEAQLLKEVEALVARVIAVDHFDPEEVRPNYKTLGHNSRGLESAAAE